ncbi:bifunctional UDP-N-acetylglucosamine diphosphorylase/glucosamine-1-phosphate N-acetyltransferase GlmU [Pseudorhodoplanes sp.]|uniref:bifunctional UDP-N-acetylglucosamine diphosphorylase/glucosamine-1-phosphate N-acetyltransferase GlmU n=1 Tax=Pseudorhodoplanes sp. TaxID=1934341 RepID=UPI002C211875|nr:bifunctional UDP-N-acetylglucosamine diphosphorylase/glucosamine-1-phosphate N-acetyltransferase GlmU [Pseudorhodoplanes sp.]HWV50937.1 bifunctional UDP-N-acetylglucosamine diphosphorylase/glucosamine-1-phosphate N-acetyltransferase GlmU [Pseudorhodoplanes sp.]
MTERTCLAVVLGAGEGTRMRSSLPKVLHPIGNEPLLAHVLRAVAGAGASDCVVVVGPDHDAVAKEAGRIFPKASIARQMERLGTAHAVLAARSALERGFDDILVVFADTPLVRAQTLQRLRAAIAEGAAVAVAGFTPADPTGYGRLITENGRLVAIREHNDASEAERAIGLCNGGLMALDGRKALALLDRIGNANAKKEFYLTDAVALANEAGLRAVAVEVEEDDVRGVNTKTQLAETEAVLQRRLRQAALDAGVTMTAPETVYLSADTKLASGVTIEPYVVFGPGVTVEAKAVIHSFSYLTEAHIGEGALIGPFARLRPGARIGKGAKIGNFVEVKQAVLEDGAKANHLAYIGDARVGEGANIGAGTIFCNYDGSAKHRTDIGKGAFVGSNSALVAPVNIGDGAYIGSGSVITENVPADSLALGRVRQVVKEGWASRLRSLKAAGKNEAG